MNKVLENILKLIVVAVILVAFVFVIGEPIEESFFGIVIVKGSSCDYVIWWSYIA